MYQVSTYFIYYPCSNQRYFVPGPLSEEQREKLLKQREQYEKAAEKLEDQLMKLKEQRENLKAQGNKHEDNIMKENAKLQVGWFFGSIPF